MQQRRGRFARVVMMTAILAAAAGAPSLRAQNGRFLAKEDILLFGIGLKVEPAQQTVPKDIATIVSTFLQASAIPEGLPPFAPDAEVRGILRGPAFPGGQELVVRPNSPFNIPPIPVAGTYTLESIRLVSGSEVLLRGTPENVTIEVIEKLLVTQITARPLTAAEIREKGIVFDRSNFQAYNFAAAFAIEDKRVDINFPVLLPTLQGAEDVSLSGVAVPAIQAPPLTSLQTIIPDTLKLAATQIPNLQVQTFSLKVPKLEGQEFFVPPIPGVIVIPGDIGFLNQFFSVMLMVANVAPAGSNLSVTDLTADMVLPAGNDTVVGSGDDPLRMARTAQGETPHTQPVRQPGADGKLGTADDVPSLGPGDTGNAEFLVEGVREGSHVVEMEITGTLHGLPVGPVTVRGRAAGSVLVRNPSFTLTFIHPEVVTAGERYTLDVTVTNTSESPANFVSLSLSPRHISGATIVSCGPDEPPDQCGPTRQIESISPGDSASVSFHLISRRTGKVTAATLDSDEKVAGRFALKTAVGELGVPLSPESLVLPKEASSLPKDLREAALGLLGKAWAVATAPAAALPKDVRRFSKKTVFDRAVEVAEAGFRVALHEPLAESAAQLAMDFTGSNFARLADFFPKLPDQEFERNNFIGFDELRRKSVRGDVFARSVAALLAPNLASQGLATFHHDLAQRWSYRPPFLSVLIAGAGGPLPFNLVIVDSQGRRVGGTGLKGKVIKDIPFSDWLPFADQAGAATAQLAILAAPDPGDFEIRLDKIAGVPDDAPFSLSLVIPDAAGGLRQITYEGITGLQAPTLEFTSGEPYRAAFELFFDGLPRAGTPVSPTSSRAIADPPPSVISVVQQKDADVLCGAELGRVVAVLFSEEVTAASVQDKFKPEDITGYAPDANAVVGVALQPGRRIAFLALRDPVGPFIERHIAISAVSDLRGQAMAPQTIRIEPTVETQAAVVSGRVIQADGTPIANANVRLFYLAICMDEPRWIGISSKSADVDGRYGWDYVVNLPDRIVAVDPGTDDFRDVRFNVQRNGQRLNVDVVFLGRGTLTVVARSEAGRLLRDTAIRVTSLTDNSQYGTETDAQGKATIARIPVGNVFVEAINVAAKAQFAFSDHIPFAGAIVSREVTLLDVEHQQVVVKHGAIRGHVLQADGATPVFDVPVFVFYKHLSQPGVRCPGDPPAAECAIAVTRTDRAGAFAFDSITAGELRVQSFDQGALSQGEARLVLAADATSELNVLLSGGLGTVRGIVLDAAGQPVAGARVGGGLSLTTTAANGEFVLNDVPVGQRQIVAVSDQLGSQGSVTIDIVRAGEVVGATIVLEAIGSVSGTVVKPDGVTPVAGNKVYLFVPGESGSIDVLGVATTDDKGGYRIDKVPVPACRGGCTVSAFGPGFTEGNIAPVTLKFHKQVFRADIKFRGGGGRVTGTVFDDDGVTPLKAKVSVSGEQVLVAGGQVGVGFQHVRHYKVGDTDFTTGRFALSGILVGPFTLSAAGQFSPDPITVESAIPSPGASVEVNLRLQATSRVRGVILQPDGVTPVGRDVVVTYKSDEFIVICSESGGEESCTAIPQGIQEEIVVTDAQGEFLLPIVNAGTFTLSVEDPATGKVAQVKGAVKAGQTAELSIRLLGLGELTVQVFGSDTVTPIPGAKVVVEQLTFPQKKVTVFADTAGTAVFSGGDAFAEGEVVVRVTDLRTGFEARASGKIAREGESVVIKAFLYDASGSVEGTVFQSDGLTPVANAEVVLSNAAGPLAFIVTGPDGAYHIDLVPLGDFTVEVFEARTARRGSGAGRIDLNGQRVPLNIVEAALGIVKGRVLLAGNLAPLKGWEVTLGQTSPSGRGLPSLKTTTDIEGSFSFPGTSRGTFDMFARRNGVNGSARARGEIEREGEIVDVPMVANIIRPLVGTVAGTVFNPGGTPGGNSIVEVCRPVCPDSSVIVTAAPDGTFSVGDVELGRFTVRARSQTTRDAGSAVGELAFDGDIATVAVVLGGLSQIGGTVERAGAGPAANAEVVLIGQAAAPGEGVRRTIFADATGSFTFLDVPTRVFTIEARDPVSGLKGAAGGSVNPGESRLVRIVLEPTAALSGRVLRANGSPAQAILAELVLPGDRHLFLETGADGAFSFGAVPLGGASFRLDLSDPIGPGLASRVGQLAGDVALGDIVLDEAPPVVASATPAASAIGVPRNQVVRLVFSEPIQPGTIDATNVALTGPAGPVIATLEVIDNDRIVVLTPLNALQDETRYTVRVKDVKDRVVRAMPAEFVLTFTTEDITPPRVVDASPAPNTGGAPIHTPVRIKFSEPIDPTKFAGAAITLTGPAGAVAGRLDSVFGNTVLVFTPNLPLAQDTVYRVQIPPATDLAGKVQPAGTDYQFGTIDGTPPQILGLAAANNATVIENGVAGVSADVGVTHDVAFVDWYLNDVFRFTDRAAPFEFSFQATPNLGAPGSQIRVSAIATDTSGNRGAAASVLVTIAADQPPAVVITAPAAGSAFSNGTRVVVDIRATDDLGVGRVGFRAETGRPQDAQTRAVTPPASARSESFVFFIPTDAVPGSTINIEGSAADTKAQVTQAAPVAITVLDSTPPVVAITGTTTGARVKPGQQTTVVVSAQDVGGIRSIAFTAGGVMTLTETRPVDPPQNNVATSFTFTVPPTARAPQNVTLDAVAVDQAGNSTSAARVILPIADTNPPRVLLRTETGSLSAVAGRTVNVVVEGEDEVGITTVNLTGTGAFTFADARQVSPPLGSALVTFPILVPATAQPGTTLQLAATATDLFGNTSAPVPLALTIAAPIDVTLPASEILVAGETREVPVQISEPAPVGGLRLDFASRDPNVATAAPFVLFAEGETSKSVSISALAGGTTAIQALIQGVARASMTITVRGGVVRGVVRDSQLNPLAGAQLTIGDRFVLQNAVSGADGSFFVEGVPGPDVTVRALDPATRLLGFASGRMARANGFVELTVVMIPAGSILVTAVQADGTTPAGAGVQVDIFDAGNLGAPLATKFTDAASEVEFPLVTLGNYVIQTSTTDGRRGRASVALTTSGQQLTRPVAFLGQGTVSGTVRVGATPVPNARLTLRSWGIFGRNPVVTQSANPDGTFTFQVPVGQFALEARDLATNQAGSVTGTVGRHGEAVTADITLGSFASLQGTVTRADGVTVVASASVTFNGNRLTETDANGAYRFDILPLGRFNITVSEPSTRGQGRASGDLLIPGEIQTVDIALFAQGRVLVTVTDAGGRAVPSAVVAVAVLTPTGSASDSFFGTTGADGRVLFERVLAGDIRVVASFGTLAAQEFRGTLAEGELKQVALTLEPTGSITGTVFEPDGLTPATQGKVCLGLCTATQTVPIGSDGTYRFDGLRLGAHGLDIFDAQDIRRASTGRAPVALSSNGQVAARDFTIIGLGTVTGRVVNPDSSSAPNMFVRLQSFAPGFEREGFHGAQTDGGGFYRIDNVRAGDFIVSTGDFARQLLGEGSGRISRHGETVTVDIVLQNNAITPPAHRFDANNYLFDIQADGTVRSGTARRGGNIYGRLGNDTGAFFLEVVAAGATNRFTGGAIATVEERGREVVLRQDNVAGLNVTRKVFVAREGYFARYIESFSNPTAAPITVDVRVLSGLERRVFIPGCCFTTVIPGVVSTSSGDNFLDVSLADNPDRWAVLDPGTDEGDALGFAFDGPNGTSRAAVATYAASGAEAGRLAWEWRNVTVPPGATIAFLHFAVQQMSRAAAEASVRRLVELPPETLVGLTPDELQAVGNFAATAPTTVAPLPSLRGTVTGRVFEFDGTSAVRGAMVRFTSSNVLFGRTHLASADETGAFTLAASFNDSGGSVAVPVGAFTLASAHPLTAVEAPPAAGTFDAGATTGVRNVVFSNTGTVQGVVRRHTGAAVPGGTIEISGGPLLRSVFVPIGADAGYRIPGVPAGSFTLRASILHAQGTGLTGTHTATVTEGQRTVADVAIEPTGGVRGIVRTGAGAPAVNVQVVLRNLGFFTRSTRTDTAGQFAFPDVPVGAFTLTATEPNSNVPSSVDITVAQDLDAAAEITLIGLGSVQVQVNFARGIGAANAQVSIREAARGFERGAGVTDATGGLPITNVTVGNFKVTARHPVGGPFFAEATGSIAADAATASVTVTLPVVGSVTGRVTNADATAAPGIRVELRSANTAFGGFGLAMTNDQGVYRIAAVAEGRFTVTVFDEPRQLFGEASGEVTVDGEQVTANISLLSNAVSLPRNRFDANDSIFTVNANGSVRNGVGQVYEGDSFSNIGALHLELVAGGSSSRFAGATTGFVEDGGQEIAVRQQNLAGLKVTRKIFVSSTGYFARFLEILSNPTASPITVDMRLLSNIQRVSFDPARQPAVTATSSGDATLSVADSTNPDRWVALDDARDTDAYWEGFLPAIAFVFDGSNAAERAGAASFTAAPSPSASFGRLVSEWNGVTVPAGGTVVYLHFAVQQTSRAAARASAERLVQLPPEALAGLSADEIAAIRNFAVPADGLSTLEPLPATNGTVTGRVLELDGTTAVASAAVDFKSNNLFFARKVQVTSGASGSFTFTSTTSEFGGNRAIAIDGFTLGARHPRTSVQSSPAAGTFAAGQTAATQDVLFSNTGIVRGTVRRHTGAAVGGGTIRIFRSSPSLDVTVFIGSDGTYVFTGLPAGTFTLAASVPHPQGSPLTGTAPATVTAGQTTALDVPIQATGVVSGVVRNGAGSPTANVLVRLSGFNTSGNFVSRETSTQATGQYSLTDVPLGALFTLQAFEPRTGVVTTVAAVTVAQDATTAQDLTLIAVGAVQVQVNFANGNPAANAQVQISEAARSFFRFAGATDATGRLTINNVSAGAFRVRAVHPNNSEAFAEVAGTLATEGEVVPVTVVLPAVGAVQVQVNFASGSPAPNAQVNITPPGSFERFAGTTNATGRLTIASVLTGTFRVRAFHPTAFEAQTEVSGTLASEGEVVPVTVVLPPVGTVAGRVTFGTGLPAVNAQVSLVPDNFSFSRSARTNATGNYTITNVPGGRTFTVRAFHPADFSRQREATGNTLTTEGQTLTVDLVLPAKATVRVTVLMPDNTPFSGARIDFRDPVNTFFQFRGLTNAAGQLDIAGVAEGVFTVRVRDTNSGLLLVDQIGNVQPADDGGIVNVSITLTNPTGTIAGTVVANDGVTPVPGSFVEVLNVPDGLWLASATTAADGSYQATNVFSGDQGFIVRAHSPSDFGLTIEQPGSFTTPGATVTVNLTLPIFLGGFEGTVFAADGVTPLADSFVEVLKAGDSAPPPGCEDCGGVQFGSTTTGPDGTYQITGVFVGLEGFIVRAHSPSDFGVTVEQSGTMTTQGQTVTANLSLPLVRGSIGGRVFAADGATAVPGASVQISNVGGGSIFFATTATDGSYQASDLLVSTQGFTARATYRVSAEQSGVLTQGQSATVDLTLAMSIVKGRLAFFDGSAVPSPTILLKDATSRTFFGPDVLDATGNFLFFGAAIGPFTLTGQHPPSGLTVTATGELSALEVPAVANLTLPPSATVTGRVLDASGNPVPFASVVLLSGAIGFQRNASASATGTYTFDRVPVGGVFVQAQISSNLFASATVEVTADGQTLTLDLAPPGSGSVTGTVTASGGGAAPNARVTIVSFGGAGPLGRFATSATADAAGRYQAGGVPAGPIQVVATDFTVFGLGEGTLTAGGTLALDVTLGTATRLTANLDGTDGFRYDVTSRGDLSDGGTADRRLSDAYDGAYRLDVNQVSTPSVTVARSEAAGRQLALGPLQMGNFRVTRKVFVPAAGKFARFLEVVTNPTNVALPVTVRVTSNLGSDSGTRVDVAPDATNNTFAVTHEAGTGSRDPALAHIFSGAGTVPVVASAGFSNGSDGTFYQWTTTVPGGQTAIFMHFAVQREPTDAAGAEAQAIALVSLTDADALTGMTEEEKAQVRNFDIAGAPPLLVGTVQGTVFAADGQIPLPSAAVTIFDVATGRVRASARTNDTGTYQARFISGGQGFRVRAQSSPTVVAEQTGAFAASGDTVTLNFTLPVSVLSGSVFQGDGVTRVPNPTVFVLQTDAAGNTRSFGATRIDAAGNYTVVGVAPGGFTVTAQDPASGLSGEATGTLADAAVPVTVDVTLRNALACAPALPGAVSWWSWDGHTNDLAGGNGGTFENGASFAPGFTAVGLSFDGVDDVVSTANPPLTSPVNTFAIEFWAFPTETRTTTGETYGTVGTSGQRYAIAPEQRGARAGVGVSVGTNGIGVFEHGDGYLPALLEHNAPLSGWTHIAIVYENRRPSLYVNGAFVKTGLVSGRGFVHPSKTFGNVSTYGPYKGLLDEVAIYNRALTAEEVQYRFRTGALGLCVPAAGATDLAVTMTDSPDPVAAGTDVTYTVTVTNNGPNPATGVVVADAVPAGATLVSATPSQGTCAGTDMVTCNLGDVANAATATVTVVVTPGAAGVIANTAAVGANEPDSSRTDNLVRVQTTVVP